MSANPSSTPSADPPGGRKIGLYLHVPFCLRKCSYCSFFSVAGANELHNKYAEAVKIQLQTVMESGWLRNCRVETIFFGGGTPSILGPELLADLLRHLHNLPMCEGERETSIEVNPATVTASDLAQLRAAGFNRISIGIQSFSDDELRRISRPHTVAESIQTIQEARRAGFANLNLDLMYGLPGQTVEDWKQTLQTGLDQAPDHLAIYELTIEENTPLAMQVQTGIAELPAEEEVLAMMAATGEMVAKAGFSRYEISNYAKPGFQCRHNINYWRNGWYLGLGPGAVSCIGGCRCTAAADIEKFCRDIAAGNDWRSDREELSREERFRETVVMGLRMTAGVSRTELLHRFGLDIFTYYGKTLQQLEQQGLVEMDNDRLRLTNVGMNLANQVMALLV